MVAPNAAPVTGAMKIATHHTKDDVKNARTVKEKDGLKKKM